MEKISIQQFNAATAEEFAAILDGPPRVAARWLATAAEHGIVEAQVHYGQRLLQGKGVEANPGQALHWFKAAARRNNTMAMNLVGRCYENGWGIEADMAIATYWFRRSAAYGLDWGMYNYATSLTLGRGVKADRVQALAWLKKAADLGHVKSLNILGGFYEDGWEADPDADTALEYYRLAAEGGDFRGQFNYARLLAGRGRMPEALAWMRRVPETATPAFLEKMRQFLATAAQHELRSLAV
ncbi:sel1 repeat family protein [Paralcaligenes sp. KSB-10]|uniref:tetratricopeptide repeat protein n=1 Tax=Paralcaligenes sp. KSB-10 TaxID=2901142 RepID=UPI001E39F9B1|nr:tetratricopeptide repeat protein [Paralcaligenes sp. KSB-10]UHL63881.1 sel1 repeat family protein [Paralcaligenes sp. KSB-10]